MKNKCEARGGSGGEQARFFRDSRLADLSSSLFAQLLRAFEGLLVQWSFQRLSRVHFKSHLEAKMELKSAFFGSP